MANVPSANQVGALIPNVWFDVIGRVAPGGFLILGMVPVIWDVRFFQHLRAYLTSSSSVGPAVEFLVFIGISYLVGFLLGHGGFLLVDSFILRGQRVKISEINDTAKEVLSKYGLVFDTKKAQKHEEDIVRRARDLCTYLIWDRNPTLAVIFGRWDADVVLPSKTGHLI